MAWSPAGFIISGLQALQGRDEPEGKRVRHGLEDIRQAMLDALDDDGCDQYSYLANQIFFGHELLDLWYLRSDVMNAIAAMHGEALARQKIRLITAMFDGLLPKSMVSRSSPLSAY